MNRLKNGEPLRWGILGCGRISNDFIRALEYCKHSHSVVAVATSNSVERAREFVKTVELDEATVAYGSYQELLDDPDIDVIYIGNLNDAHHEWTLRALDARKPTLCEKPLAGTLKEVKQMVDRARERRVFLMEAVWSRFFPSWRHIREVIDSGKFGAPKMTSANFSVILPDSRFSAEQSESPVIDIGIYPLSFAMFVFNAKKPQKIHTATRKNSQGLDEWGNFVLDYGDNTHSICYYNGNLVGPTSAVVTFEKGQITIPEFFWNANRLFEQQTPFKNGVDTPKLFEYPLKDEATRDKFVFDNGSGMRYEADHVFECLADGKLESEIVPLDETLRVHEVMQSIREEMDVVYKQDREHK